MMLPVPRITTIHALDHRPFLKDPLSEPEKANIPPIHRGYHDDLFACFESEKWIWFRQCE